MAKSKAKSKKKKENDDTINALLDGAKDKGEKLRYEKKAEEVSEIEEKLQYEYYFHHLPSNDCIPAIGNINFAETQPNKYKKITKKQVAKLVQSGKVKL